jgi:hypothetical protein
VPEKYSSDMDVSDDETMDSEDQNIRDNEFQTWTMKDSVLFLIDAGGCVRIPNQN